MGTLTILREGEDGRRQEWRSQIIPRYQRRTERVEGRNFVEQRVLREPCRLADLFVLSGALYPRNAGSLESTDIWVSSLSRCFRSMS